MINFIIPNRKNAEELVNKYHYSGYVPTNIQHIAGIEIDGILVAAVFFSIPPTRWSEKVYELCRLVRTDDIKINLTQLISFGIKGLKNSTDADLLVSFADNTHSHHGGIYQAASWNYHGMRKSSCDGFIINGSLVTRRTCNHKWGTSSTKKLPAILAQSGIECIPHYDNGKYLYWKALSKNGEKKAVRLKLNKCAYPKPDIS